MNEMVLILNKPPELSDESAGHLLDLLYELTTALENHYAGQLRRHDANLNLDFNDDLPEF